MKVESALALTPAAIINAAGDRVGEASFAAGDLVITRVNDRAAEVFNRERWRIAEVDAAEGHMTLEGIDQAKAGEIGADYLARTNPHSEAPALEHAYAVTTYSAQGTTVDRAFIVADPSIEPGRVSRRLRNQDLVLGNGDSPQPCHDRGSTPRSCLTEAPASSLSRAALSPT